MKVLRLVFMPFVVISGVALADEAAPARVSAPLRPTLQTLKCAAGQSAVSSGDLLVCSSTGFPASERVSSPVIRVHSNGVRASEGVYVNGSREGLWLFFDEQGNKTQEVEFKNDHYDGRYVKFAGGQKVLEHSYVAGKRQGDQRTWDAAGNLTVVRYVDDRPVSK
jgi:hypothetical protein